MKTKSSVKNYINWNTYRECETCGSIVNKEIENCPICLYGKKQENRGKYKNRQKK